MRTPRIARSLLLALAVQAAPATLALPVFAQTEDASTAQARQRFKEGVDFYDKGRFEEARLAFLQAYTLKKHPAVLLNLAQSTAKAGHALEATKFFKQYLREATTASPQQRKDAETGLAEARQKLARVEVSAPAGTELTLDDSEKLGAAPFAEPIDVEPGPHTLRSPTETVKVIATLGQKVEARFGATAAPTPPPPGPAPTPAEPAPQGAGATAEAEAAPPPVDTATYEKKGILSPPKNLVPVYVGAGVTVAGFASALVFMLFRDDAQSKADAIEADIREAAERRSIPSAGICGSADPQVQADFGKACRTFQDNRDTVNLDATLANVGLGVGVAGAVFTVAYWLVADKHVEEAPQTSAQRFRPVLTPYGGNGSGGLMLRGTF